MDAPLLFTLLPFSEGTRTAGAGALPTDRPHDNQHGQEVHL